MASPHVPVARALRLPRAFAHVAGYLAIVDADLRIRRSVEKRGMYVIERRCRRRSAIHTGLRDGSDIHVQRRDGYIHVATVHPSYLLRPWNIVRELLTQGEDVWMRGGANRVEDELEYEEGWRRETNKRRRRERFRSAAREMWHLLNRHGNGDGTEVTRFNNPGLPRRAAPASS